MFCSCQYLPEVAAFNLWHEYQCKISISPKRDSFGLPVSERKSVSHWKWHLWQCCISKLMTVGNVAGFLKFVSQPITNCCTFQVNLEKCGHYLGFKFPGSFFILQHRLVKTRASCFPLCYRRIKNTALYSGGTVADTAVSFATWQHGERSVAWGLSVSLGSVHGPKDGYQWCSGQF